MWILIAYVRHVKRFPLERGYVPYFGFFKARTESSPYGVPWNGHRTAMGCHGNTTMAVPPCTVTWRWQTMGMSWPFMRVHDILWAFMGFPGHPKGLCTFHGISMPRSFIALSWAFVAPAAAMVCHEHAPSRCCRRFRNTASAVYYGTPMGTVKRKER